MNKLSTKRTFIINFHDCVAFSLDHSVSMLNKISLAAYSIVDSVAWLHTINFALKHLCMIMSVWLVLLSISYVFIQCTL